MHRHKQTSPSPTPVDEKKRDEDLIQMPSWSSAITMRRSNGDIHGQPFHKHVLQILGSGEMGVLAEFVDREGLKPILEEGYVTLLTELDSLLSEIRIEETHYVRKEKELTLVLAVKTALEENDEDFKCDQASLGQLLYQDHCRSYDVEQGIDHAAAAAKGYLADQIKENYKARFTRDKFTRFFALLTQGSEYFQLISQEEIEGGAVAQSSERRQILSIIGQVNPHNEQAMHKAANNIEEAIDKDVAHLLQNKNRSQKLERLTQHAQQL